MKTNMDSHKNLNVCKKCRSRINAYGAPAFELVCHVYINQKNQRPSFYDMADEETEHVLCPVVQFLENKGIFSTRECHQSASLIHLTLVEKYCEENEMRYLCWCGDN